MSILSSYTGAGVFWYMVRKMEQKWNESGTTRERRCVWIFGTAQWGMLIRMIRFDQTVVWYGAVRTTRYEGIRSR